MKYNRYPKRDAVYAYLMYCEDRKTFQCHPSYKTIGSAVGLSKNTVKKHIDGLIAKQLITTELTAVITKKGQKHNGTLLYTIRPIQEAVEYRYQQQLAHLEAEMYRQKALARIEKLYGDQGSKSKQEKGGVALSGHPHKNFSERRDFCKLRSNLRRMFDVFGHFNVQNGGSLTAKSNSRADALQMRQPLSLFFSCNMEGGVV